MIGMLETLVVAPKDCLETVAALLLELWGD
jgi:hypothetical protein